MCLSFDRWKDRRLNFNLTNVHTLIRILYELSFM